ncbi:helicase-associated domain-containing protein [Corynebacterium senegalense]|uniref:helicase-associated domain-containing protein n=1 Tax=Corynebacterium senegalense TaxID=2080750 RepID=UPI000E1FC327|nr:helicase-associated domain-containing protein [Corynebacterium senegalense]
MHDITSALAAMSDEELRRLIDARPDATFPTPPSLASLATRLSLPASVARAVRRLNAAEIAVLETLGDLGAELEPVPADRLADLPLDVAAGVEKLRAAALIFGPDDALRVSPGALSGLPAGWRILDPAPDGLAEKLAALGERERRVLETLAASGGVGTTRATEGAVARLVELGLLVRVDESTVRLPRPVREALRGGEPRVYPVRPSHIPARDQGAVDASATAQGLDAVRQMRQLFTLLLQSPVPLNKDGSVGVRALAALRKTLGFAPELPVTVGEAAGLIGRGSVDAAGDADVLAATPDALTWLDAALPDQWAILIAGWMASPWRSDLGEAHRLLSEDTHVPDVRGARTAILGAAGGDLMARLLYTAPLTAAGMSPALIEAVSAEAHAVGALADGAPSSVLLALLDGGDAAQAARELVPAEVDSVIPQADMTILAPGPLTPAMARMIESFAELESPGLASVYRVSEASVRRALDAGGSAEEILSWLGTHSIGEVPQALSFLVTDVARHHGSLRAGAVASYVRSEDAALLAEAAGRVASLSVLAPTVAVSTLPLPELLAQLRAAGLQPSAEDSSGAVLRMAPEPKLVAATPSTLPRERTVDAEHTAAVLTALRSGEAAGEGDHPETDTLGVLRAAARARRHVKLGYVDRNGRGRTLTVLPLSVGAGQADVVEESSGNVVRIALPRVTGAVLA